MDINDFTKGMRVVIARPVRPEMVGKRGTVARIIKRGVNLVEVALDEGGSYEAFPTSLDLVELDVRAEMVATLRDVQAHMLRTFQTDTPEYARVVAVLAKV